MDAASRKVVTNRVSFIEAVLRTTAIIYRSIGGWHFRVIDDGKYEGAGGGSGSRIHGRLAAHELLDLPHCLRHGRHEREDEKARVDGDQHGPPIDGEVLFEASVQNSANLGANLADRFGPVHQGDNRRTFPAEEL